VGADLPLTRLVLGARSLADDLSFVALGDLSGMLQTTENRIIGGHMVQLHVYRWRLGTDLYRETQDADIGLPLMAARDPSFVSQLLDLGYVRITGNSFGRVVEDIPVERKAERLAVVDVLVPAHTSRPRQNRKIGEHLVTTEVPGLSEAFRRPPVIVDLELTRLNGAVVAACIAIPDELSALVLKVMAWRVRGAMKDAVDVWRCCEIALAAGVDGSALGGKTGDAVREALQRGVHGRDGPIVSAIVALRHLSPEAGDGLHTRLRALVHRILRE
jgi:hypothetical protein